MLSRIASEQKGRHKFRFKNPLKSLNAAVIGLCLSLYDWADIRRTKGAITLHLQQDHSGYLPCFALVTDGKTKFERGTIEVFDRGYNNYGWFNSLTVEGVFFVTRLKSNAVYRVVENRKVPQGKNVLKIKPLCSAVLQNHKIKTFLGTSTNAVKTQI